MRKIYKVIWTKTCYGPLLFLALFCVSSIGQAQTPAYYNYNTNGSNNSFPFGIAAGKQVQLLYLPGDFNQPTPAPSSHKIVSVSFRIGDTYPISSVTYNDLTIKMGQSAITTFAAGVEYTGTLTTVYYRTSVTLSAPGGTWMTITLDSPFYYDPTQSLIVDISHCSSPTATGFPNCFTNVSGNRRNWSVGGCPFTYGGQNAAVYHMGIDMIPMNDSCKNAVTVACGSTTFDNTTFSTNNNAPSGCSTSLNTAPGLWYKFTATGDLTEVNTCGAGTNFDTKIGVFTGNCNNLVCVGSNDDGCSLKSKLVFCSKPGVEYYVYVTGWGTSKGNFELAVLCGMSPPVITNCPSDITQGADPGTSCEAYVTVPVPVPSVDYNDNCGIPAIVNDYTGTDDASGTYPFGSTTVKWTVTDSAGNTATCNQTITVTDNLPPVLHCPADIVQPTDSGACGAVVNYTPPVGIDNCPQTFFLANSITQTLAGTGLNCNMGLIALETRHAVIFDLPARGISNTLNLTDVEFGIYNAAAGSGGVQPASIKLWTLNGPMADSNLTFIDSLAIVIPDQSNSIFSVPMSATIPANSKLVVEIHIPDGQVQNNIFFLGVSPNGQSSPSWLLSNDCLFPQFTNLDSLGYFYDYLINIKGNVIGTNMPTQLVSGIGPGGLFPIGTTTEVYQSGDYYGNYTTCQMKVIVMDNEVPSINCAPDITVSNDPGTCTASNVGCNTVNGFAGAFDPFYWHFSQLNADGYVNTSGAPDSIIIRGGNNGSDSSGFTNCSIPVTCDGSITFNWEYTAGDSAAYDVPQYSLTGGAPYTFLPGFSLTGPKHQAGSATIPVLSGQTFVFDVYTTDNLYGAAKVTLSNFSGPGVSMPVVFDNCAVASVTSDHPSTVYDAGLTVVTWTVTDIHGNTNNCQQLVRVNETELPVITCPAAISVSADPGVCTSSAAIGTATFTDNCTGGSVAATPAGPYAVGNTTVTWTATDANGNTSSCTQVVTVTDDESPEIICPADTTIVTVSDTGAVYVYTVSSFDNCAVSNSHQIAGLSSGSVFPEGTTTNTWIATDAAGNSSTCSFYVSVISTSAMEEISGIAAGIYPNPTSGKLSIALSKGCDGTRIFLYTAEGKLIRMLCDGSQGRTVNIDISDIAAGLYFLKFENQQTTFFRKVVKN